MADNTCHFGINNMFADNGLETEDSTRLYFPGDANQLKACLDVVFPQPGLRFVFTTRSKVPQVLDDKGNEIFAGNYKFKPGKDDLVRTGTAGYIVSFGDALYRCVDAVDRLQKEGVDVGLINKSTLNVVDEDMIKTIGKTGFVLVVEPLSQKTGLGSKFGTWLISRGLTPKYAQIGCSKEGSGGLWEHAYHQGYDLKSIMEKVKTLC